MLFSFLGVYVDQEEFVEAAGIRSRLHENGMTVEEMGRAVAVVYPYFTLWYKEHASGTDLSTLVNEYHFPVGVEWQGVFLEDDDEDNGHYSIVTHVDLPNNLVMLADPYMKFAGVDRSFSLTEFIDRWWDVNDVQREDETIQKKDDKLLFIVTPQEASFPELLSLKQLH